MRRKGKVFFARIPCQLRSKSICGILRCQEGGKYGSLQEKSGPALFALGRKLQNYFVGREKFLRWLHLTPFPPLFSPVNFFFSRFLTRKINGEGENELVSYRRTIKLKFFRGKTRRERGKAKCVSVGNFAL